MILPEEVVYKVSGVAFATTLQAQESEVPKETTAKKRKKNSSGKDPDMRELTVSQESDFSEPLPSPFEDFVINRPESTASDASAVDTPLWENEPEPAEEGNMTQEDVPEESVRTRKKTKASAAAVEAETVQVEQSIKEQEQQPKKVYKNSANESSEQKGKRAAETRMPSCAPRPRNWSRPCRISGFAFM